MRSSWPFASSSCSGYLGNLRAFWLRRRSAKRSSFVYAATQSSGNRSGPLSWSVLSPHQRGSSVWLTVHPLLAFRLQHLDSEDEAHEELNSKVQLEVEGTDEDALGHQVPLINDHNPSFLPSLIRCGTPGSLDGSSRFNGHGPSKPHRAYCDICFQSTGVGKFLGNDKEFTAYYTEEK